MKYIALLLATLLLSAQASAAIAPPPPQARNMDDVQSLGVIYINHNLTDENDAEPVLVQRPDAAPPLKDDG
ncbi:hypothetical protein IAE49_21495 [Kosakonia sp. S58]|nr:MULTISPECIES: hypothetical protein [unclassified Kosakonia]MBK0079459.1 hypothetical protein [Kosakonia sp. S57]MBK0088813.1 hypothetical protein [Kosakonia sp. S58]